VQSKKPSDHGVVACSGYQAGPVSIIWESTGGTMHAVPTRIIFKHSAFPVLNRSDAHSAVFRPTRFAQEHSTLPNKKNLGHDDFSRFFASVNTRPQVGGVLTDVIDTVLYCACRKRGIRILNVWKTSSECGARWVDSNIVVNMAGSIS
jgi:hypothetical protein